MKKITTPTNRQFKVGEELRHAIAEIFMRGELHSPDLESHSITVSEVRISPNLRSASVYVMPLGGTDKEKVLKQLEQITPLIRTLLARKVYMKYLPQLKFVLDQTFDNASKINELLNKSEVQRDLS